MTANLQQMLDCNSFINIEYLAETALPSATPEQAELLNKILNSTCLDSIHLLLAEALGQTELATSLRDWLAKKGERNARKASALLELGF